MTADETLRDVRGQVVIITVALASDDERLMATALNRLGALLDISEDEVNRALRVWQEHRPQGDEA